MVFMCIQIKIKHTTSCRTEQIESVPGSRCNYEYVRRFEFKLVVISTRMFFYIHAQNLPFHAFSYHFRSECVDHFFRRPYRIDRSVIAKI